ncbi:MAG: FeoA family protein [Bacilli bacterium]|nr:FeoA family protein [Bacilli bacterium]MDD4298230.1 FeoA family protein [Bacilli bacterium]
MERIEKMTSDIISLTSLLEMERGKVKQILIDGPIRRRLMDLGLINGTIVEVLQKSPFGDPIAYLIRGAVIALRQEVSSMIIIEKV